MFVCKLSDIYEIPMRRREMRSGLTVCFGDKKSPGRTAVSPGDFICYAVIFNNFFTLFVSSSAFFFCIKREYCNSASSFFFSETACG